MEQDHVVSSSISSLIARIEAYTFDSASFTIPGSSTRHELWLQDEPQRIDSATQLAEELMALQSIYTEEAIHLVKIASINGDSSMRLGQEEGGTEDVADPNSWSPGSKITLSISTDVEIRSSTDQDVVPIRLAVTLAPFYPHSARPPQLQLLSRYIGGFSVDSKLFGEILRAFYQQSEEEKNIVIDAEDATGSAWIGGIMHRGVKWSKGQVVLFEGIEWVKEKVMDWWNVKEAERAKRAPTPTVATTTNNAQDSVNTVTTFVEPHGSSPISQPIPAFKRRVFQTESIMERKSEFIGYAATITCPDQVGSVLSLILSDKRVARATHPIINAWVCKDANGVVYRDCDDDGETAAGGRLAHLLSLLELDNVIVVVTRWYGGVHLGADRFKLINRAAKEALDLGGFVGKNKSEEGSKAKGMGKRSS
ncbi:related to YIH1 [Melanopsichium pennsylvanicum]|uniref:Related to YIH1 n=2 Tax=Melanopsichium pennsylvanicum TaxID=63383 RepID=A0AAJ4XND1_9BASI|nr:related to YIH1 [Melanopsichium pennsylvanicum 4]SNX85519.1 related to YIH1 [Melanopsichium pennsylvanicum]